MALDKKKILDQVANKLSTIKEEREAEKQQLESERRELIASIGADVVNSLSPHLQEMARNSKISKEDLQAAFANVQINVPEQEKMELPPFPEIKVPTPQVHVTVPEVKVPKIEMPDQMKVIGAMELSGVDKKNPLPVIMMGLDGKPFSFSFAGGSGGGKADFLTILGIQNTVAASLVDSLGVGYSGSNPLPISGSLSTTPFATYFASDAVASTNQIQIAGNSIAVDQGISNTGTQRVVQATDVGVSVNVAAQTVTLETRQVSGAVDSVNISGFTATVASIPTNGEGTAYNSDNPLPVTFSAAATQAISIPSLESPLNSSTTNLGIGGTFTGLAEDIKDYATSQVSVFSDVASATDGLSVQQSSNGTNWDITDVFTVPASTGKTYSFQVVARYFRIVYTNGGTGQGAFRLYTVHHKVSPKGSSQRPQDALSNENDFEQISAFMSALNPSGSWDRLRTQIGSQDAALRVVLASDASASVNVLPSVTGTNETNASVIRAILMSDTLSSINLMQWNGVQATGLNETNNGVVRTTIMTDVVASTNIAQWGGTAPAQGLNENGNGVVKIAGISSVVDSVNVVTFNGNAPATGLNETNSGVLRTVLMTDSISSVFVTGFVDSTIVPYARTTNPTAKADGADVRPMYDDLGRQITRNVHVRDLIATAYVALTNGTETTLLAASAGGYADLIMITATNNSSAATQLDIRATSGGNIIHTMYLPATTGPVGFSPSVPWPQDSTGNSWTIDMPDQTGTTVYVSALFSREV